MIIDCTPVLENLDNLRSEQNNIYLIWKIHLLSHLKFGQIVIHLSETGGKTIAFSLTVSVLDVHQWLWSVGAQLIVDF